MILEEAHRKTMERDEDAWRHTLAIATSVLNWGFRKGKRWRDKPISYLFNRLVKGKEESEGRTWTVEEVADAYKLIEERRAARKARRIASGELAG